ncbi:hypothetical protein ACGFZL_06375 [Streptomyces sp. NPDC048182]|uniref:hypothetical protein n=1 Tax=Streptomyces sp. NPDC048182 TaxID=3365507 RepID=UPI00371CB38A
MPVVPWADAWEFAVSDVELPVTHRRRRAVPGARAVRVPYGAGARRVNAPCAFLPRDLPPKAPAKCLYEDPEGQRLLCSVSDPSSSGGVRQYGVLDAQGRPLGTIHRLAALKHALRPTWRLEQPGRPEIRSSAEWAEDGPSPIVTHGIGKLLSGVAQTAADLGAEGGDQPARSRTLEWRSGEELVMTSSGDGRFLIRAAWLDRRLAFAYALLRAHPAPSSRSDKAFRR